MEQKQEQSTKIYYLVSEYFGNECVFENTTCIDPTHVANLFEVVKTSDVSYKIIKIIKNKDDYEVNDIIYVDVGMLAFYTKYENGKINKSTINSTTILEKNKITLFCEEIDDTVDKLIDLIQCISTQYNDKLDPKYINIKHALMELIYIEKE